MPNLIANKLVPVKNDTAGAIIELHDARITVATPQSNEVLMYDSTVGNFTNQSLRTANHETLTDSSRGDANLLDGFYFPNAVRDHDGNWYGAVVIGDQVWLAENLRTTHYADGTEIPAGGNNNSATEPYYYDYSASGIPLEERGYLYNWPAVMNEEDSSSANPSGVQGIAPTGWHVPSDAEWMQLTDYVGRQERYRLGGYDTYIAKALASTEHWNTGTGDHTPGNDPGRNNATGFGAVPAGNWYGGFGSAGSYAYFWSSTEYGTSYAWYRGLGYGYAGVFRGYRYRSNGFSVRCVSDLSPVQFRDWYVRNYGSLQHHIETGEANVQADWNQTDNTADDYINNKPTIPADSGLVHRANAETMTGVKTHTADIVLKSSTNSGNTPSVVFQRGTATDAWVDWKINGTSSYFKIQRSYNGTDTDKVSIDNTKAFFADNVEAAAFVKTDGTSEQFLKADGSVDSNTYLTAQNTVTVYSGTGTPDNSTGSDGDIYIKTVS